MHLIHVHPSVSQAVAAGRPLVALESALITHGFAYPANIEITQQMIAVIEAEGALPAVIGIWQGEPVVGLSQAQIAALGETGAASKVSTRDLPLMGVRGMHGGTTVAATMVLAHLAGLRVFATGGIGGVHRGHPEDVSADLPTLAATPLIVTCAGAKSILDLSRTLEVLETYGVPVLGWQTPIFPAFYSRDSGLPVDQQVAGAEEVAEVYRVQRALRLPQGLLVTASVPAADEIPAAEIDPLIEQAVREADVQGIAGKALTPYILARMVALSGARTQRANGSLLLNNARIAAQIACALA